MSISKTSHNKKTRALRAVICLYCFIPQLLLAQPNISSPEDIDYNPPSTPSTPPPTPTPPPPPPALSCTVTKINFTPYNAEEWFKLTGTYSAPAQSIFVPPNPKELCLHKIIQNAEAFCGKGQLGSSAGNSVPRDPIFENFINRRGGGGQWGTDDCSYYFTTWVYKYGVSLDGILALPSRQAMLDELGRRVTQLVNSRADLAQFRNNLDAGVLYPTVKGTGSRADFFSRFLSQNLVYEKSSAFLDSNCNVTAAPASASQICEELNQTFIISPISLLWEDNAEIEDKVSIVKFPLSKNSDSYVHWRASSSSPLLVYDPEHKGIVDGADQLFGNWTFGGKKSYAALSDSIPTTARPWDNGYEALATLDVNKDGHISGTEISELALWFDNNQDGKSDPGEVIPATKLGLKTLYYKNAIKSSNGFKIELSKGYEKEVDGKLVTGKSVDWYSDEFGTAREALQALEAKRAFSNLSADVYEKTSQGTSDYKSSKSPHHVNTSGMWNWHIDTKNDESSKDSIGILKIQHRDNVLYGESITEIPVQITSEAKPLNIKSKIFFHPLVGEQREDEVTGQAAFHFDIIDHLGKLSQSSFIVEKESNGVALKLNGKTKTKILLDKGKEVEISYNWSATRK